MRAAVRMGRPNYQKSARRGGRRYARRVTTRVGPYTLIRPLGQGGMGLVVAAQHLTLRKNVAVKLLLPHRPMLMRPRAAVFRRMWA